MAENPYDMNTLLSYEADELRQLHLAWKHALASRDFEAVDALRKQLTEWQTSMAWLADGQWHSIAEPAHHRDKRTKERMSRYKVEIYPYTSGWKPENE